MAFDGDSTLVSGVADAVALAASALQREVRRRGLSEYVEVARDESHVRILLRSEDRQMWVGHVPARGYFLVNSVDAQPSAFFELTDEAILGLLPGASDGSDQVSSEQRACDADALLASITSDSPDVREVEEILDRVPATDEGLDVLSTVAAIRARRHAISRLKAMLAEEATREREFQDLVADEPWMLGAQYQLVVAKERDLWFGARVDLLLQSVLGYVDVVEFKRPDATLLTRASRARTWKQSAELADAYSQAQEYLRLIDENRSSIEAEFGLGDSAVSRMYRSSVIIVAGRAPEDKGALDVIRGLNAAFERIVLMTYDEVLSIAEATIALFERRLARHGFMLGK